MFGSIYLKEVLGSEIAGLLVILFYDRINLLQILLFLLPDLF